MSNLALHSQTVSALIKPEPRGGPINVRVATERDLPFIDALQKKHGKAVAFASYTELLSHINESQTALIAEDQLRTPIGYCLYKDRYFKREDCGNIVQLVVAAQKHRGLVGAELIKAMFERVPYGVRLFCCWCAQDLEANHFWEALGFVPLACRAGSRGKEHGGRRSGGTRVQIFWERRVREGDEYPYWYPSQTHNGRMGESRIVLPIPPGKHWSDELPLVLPGGERIDGAKALESGGGDEPKRRKPRTSRPKTPALPANSIAMGGLRFAPIPTSAELVEQKPAPPKPKRQKHKNDPKHIAAARELRDRYLEEVNTGRMLPTANGKYDVSRQLEAAPSTLKQTPLLKAA